MLSRCKNVVNALFCVKMDDAKKKTQEKKINNNEIKKKIYINLIEKQKVEFSKPQRSYLNYMDMLYYTILLHCLIYMHVYVYLYVYVYICNFHNSHMKPIWMCFG